MSTTPGFVVVVVVVWGSVVLALFASWVLLLLVCRLNL